MKLNKEILWLKHNEHDLKDLLKAKKLVEEDKYFRPKYHIAPPNGLLNDPNGLLYKDNEFHIHYQWSPVQPYHGYKHWRYLTTKDFVNYKNHGVSITPDHEDEKWGAFSGSAYNFDGNIKIYYTGNMEQDGAILEEHQLVADLIDNKIKNKKTVVKHDEDIFTPHARDPKILDYEGKQYLIFGVQTKNDMQGGLAFYNLINPEKFEYFLTLKPKLNHTYGYMWECPNFDKLEDKYLFMISSEGWFDLENKYELNSSRNVVYTAIKKLDFENKNINEEFKMKTMDYGHDFYAPQTFLVNNKLVLIAWLGAVDVQYPTDIYSWHSMLTIPRELSWNKDILVQKPLKEFCDNVIYNTKKIKSKKIDAQFSKHLKFELNENLEMKLINEQNEEVVLKFTDDEIILDRSKQGEKVEWNFETPRYAKRKLKKQIVEIFIDSSSIEIFADSYNTIFSSRFFLKNWNQILLDKEIEIEVSDIREMQEI